MKPERPEPHESEEDLFSIRIEEQKNRSDFDYLEDGTIDKCYDCGALVNSHGHCPCCDY